MAEKVYDFVIIGSGLGGLQCAYILADHGYSVCVLEKNQQLGGSLQVFSRDKTVFDTGVHYLPAMDEGQALHSYFKYFGLTDSVKWKKMDNHFDQISFDDGSKFHHASSWNEFEKTLIADFPEEENAIYSYSEAVQKAVKTFPLDELEFNELDHTDNELLDISAKAFIDGLTQNEKLRAVLAGSNLLYAGSAEKCPLYVHALVTHGYVLSAYRCIDGGSQLAKELSKRIREKGGEVLRRKMVISFDFEDGQLKSAKTEDGETYHGKNFISNIQPKVLLQLIGKEHLRPSYYNRFQRAPHTLSSFSVHIVCKPESFPYLNQNVYHHTTNDVWAKPDYSEDEWPPQFMLSTPATSKTDEYAEGISIMTYMRFDEVEQWKDSHNTIASPGTREESYEQFKQRKTEQLLKAVSKRFPSITDSIHSVHASTPLTFRDYIGSDDGNMYGTEKDYRKGLTNFISPKTKISNLWLTGQYLNLHGIFGVTISSVVTCSQFLDKKKLLDRIKQAE
ncbi:MAG TPA: all-trans-retinol 13,14-reductase [Flavobacteriales bacterium]|nr:all-trans-retinol 13,14-reductase [Flavobacteriales bacterium]